MASTGDLSYLRMILGSRRTPLNSLDCLEFEFIKFESPPLKNGAVTKSRLSRDRLESQRHVLNLPVTFVKPENSSPLTLKTIHRASRALPIFYFI
jgi:hypothetical protein